jgi:aldehyde:ferredoxin oxidoreductase
VDLSAGKITIEAIPLETLHQYVGGRGLGAKILYEEVSPQVQPLNPENKLIFTVGPLTGTRVPTSGRFSVTTKSPLTGTIFDSNSGGIWGVRFKRCGFDALIVEGKSPLPVYLTIQDDQLAIKPAHALWGLDVPSTTALLLAEEGEKASVACIGPAGENLVKMASIMNDIFRALGRGGVGAVMGSKNLKAIVVNGSQQVQVADQEKLDFVLYETNKWLKAIPITSQGLPEFGTAVLVNLFNELGIFPTRNFQAGQFAGAEAISGETLAETLTVKKRGCYACPIQCTRVTMVKGQESEGPEYETLWSLGAQCGIAHLETIVEANMLCNRLGLDTISTGVTLGCAMELAQRGLLDSGLNFGDVEKLIPTIESIAYRRGLGDELAEGSRRLAEKYHAPQYAMQVKGLEFPAYDPRGVKGMGLAFATSNRGACHLRAYMVGPEILGVPKMVDRFATGGKAGLTINFQNANAAMDTLILCRFIGLAVSEEYFARLLSAVTGVSYQPQDLHLTGERIWNLERLYNLREGFTFADDNLPERLLSEPLPEGPAAGHTVDLQPMIKEYYRFRGWDSMGVPSAKKLAQLGLEVR